MTYVFADIHGESEILKKAISIIPKDSKKIFLGDYIDRGPNSKEVIDVLMSLENSIFLLGNHEDILLEILNNKVSNETLLMWLTFGGYETLDSYNIPIMFSKNDLDKWYYNYELLPIDAFEKQVQLINFNFPDTHKEFLESMKLWHQEDNYLFVHGGINPFIDFYSNKKSDFLWIRQPFLTYPFPYKKDNKDIIVVHGHTPIEKIEIHNNRIPLDFGAVFGNDYYVYNLEEKEYIKITRPNEYFYYQKHPRPK